MNMRRFFIRQILVVLVICVSLSVGVAKQAADSSASKDAPAQTPPTPQRRVNIECIELNLPDVLNAIAKQYGINIVVDSDVTGKVTLTLKDVTIEQVLDAILARHGCAYTKLPGDIYRVSKAAPKPPPAPEEKLNISYEQRLLSIEAMNVDVTRLLQEIAAKTGLNINYGAQVTGKVTIPPQKGITVEPGLRYVLAAQGLSFERYGNVYIVEKIAPAQQQPGTAGLLGGVDVEEDRITLHVDNKPLKDVLETLRRRLDIDLIVVGTFGQETVTVHLSKVSLPEALTALLRGTKFWFKKIDRQNLEEVSTLLGGAITEIGAADKGVENGKSKMEKGGNEGNGSTSHPQLPIPNPQPSTGNAMQESRQPPTLNPQPSGGRERDIYLIGDISPGSAAAPLLTKTEVIYANYMKAEELVRLLTTLSSGGGGAAPVAPVAGGAVSGSRSIGGAGVFSMGGGVRVMPDHNAFAITATEETLSNIKREIALLDIPAPQVVMETMVTELTSSTLKELGVNFTGGEGQVTATLPGGPALVFSKAGDAIDFTVTIRALVDKGKANVIANPRLATLSGHEASIDVTQERYFRVGATTINTPTTGGQQGQSGTVIGGFLPYVDLRQIRAGVQVKITPWVGGNGEILIDLQPTISSITGTGPEGLPEISSRSATVTLRVRDGETVLIGGLKQKERSRSQRKVPLVSSIPVIGNLFRSTNINERETELLIMVTPHIIRGTTGEDAVSMLGQSGADRTKPKGR